jgi:phosphonate transport system permease protein
VTAADHPAVWRRRSPRTQLAIWAGWLLLVALFVFCWQVMNRNTIWMFVLDAPTQTSATGCSRRAGPICPNCCGRCGTR